jgi:hypothetical protein
VIGEYVALVVSITRKKETQTADHSTVIKEPAVSGFKMPRLISSRHRGVTQTQIKEFDANLKTLFEAKSKIGN